MPDQLSFPGVAEDMPRGQDGPPMVLIVEDEHAIAESVGMIVEDAGYAAVLAANGRQALALAHEHAPALIITDLMMPVMSGEEFVARLRAEHASTGVPLPPIVLMTAVSAAYARELAPDAILIKPFDLASLERLLARFLSSAT